MSQWRCRQCGAIRSRPTHARVNENPAAYSVRFLGSKPCKRCGSAKEPDAMYDPWLDFEETFEPVSATQQSEVLEGQG